MSFVIWNNPIDRSGSVNPVFIPWIMNNAMFNFFSCNYCYHLKLQLLIYSMKFILIKKKARFQGVIHSRIFYRLTLLLKVGKYEPSTRHIFKNE